ncbi:MAG: SDR family oxidoreductase [Pseudomonadota bacterium]
MPPRSILITGGGTGIGAAIATECASRECAVLITGRQSTALDAVAERSSHITPIAGDVTNASHRTSLAEALASLPAPRALFHAAGFFQTGLLNTLSHEDWQRSFDTNVTARWDLTRQALPALSGGRILFVGSDAGRNPRHGAAAYSIAQSASETLRRSFQTELAQTDIAVTDFKPGLVDTPMVRGFLKSPDKTFPGRRDYLGYIERGELTAPQTVAKFATWLLCDVEHERFRMTEWDIRDDTHHHEWLNGPLFLSIDATR